MIGPGFGRTGTNSLRLAIEHLGFGPCHHMFEVRDNPELLPAWQATINPFVEARGSHSTAHMNAIAEMCHQFISCAIFDDRLADRNHAIGKFEKHIESVQTSVPAERLLTFNVAEGWAPLCAFLNVGVPDTPFPRTNSTKEFAEAVAAQE